MAIAKIILNGTTQIDLTQDTVAASNLISPNTAHGADGNPVTGTATTGFTITDEANTTGTTAVISDGNSSEGSTDTWETLLSTQVTMTQGTLYYFRVDNYTEPITVNDEYRITWGTVTHTFIPLLDSGDDSYYIGNPVINGGTDDGSGIPLILYNSDSTHLVGETTDSGSKYLKIERKVSGGSTPSATSHTIYFEFSDGTDSTITAYYDSQFISDAITATTPTTYNQKTVTLAELDGVTWYEPTNIPLNTELVDYTTMTAGMAVDAFGSIETADPWYYATDYIRIDPNMTFSYLAIRWGYIGVYDENKNVVRVIDVSSDGTVDPNNSNLVTGTLSGNKIAGATYVVLTAQGNNSYNVSLIRTS